MLLRNARFGGKLHDVSIENGVIAAITTAGELPGPADEVDVAGRWLLPGLWDNHVHYSQWSLSAQRLDLSAASSAAEAARAVGAALRGLPDQAAEADALPFVGVGFRDGLWADAPSLELLDAASGERPVVLLSGDLHAVWVNSAALALYGHSGHPTGLLREDEAFVVTHRAAAVPEQVLDGWARSAGEAAAARGIVGIVDLEMDWNLGNWTHRMASGFDCLRVEFAVYTEHLDRAIELGLRTGDRLGELLTMGGYKVLTDGSLNTRTAYCYDEYPGHEGEPGSHGMLTVPPERLGGLLRRAVGGGISPIVHAIGDNAVALVLDSFEALGSGGRMEHAQLLADIDATRFAALGVEVSIQPEHLLDDRDVADRHWAGRTQHAYAFRTLHDAGATLRLGSDAPVSPLDPWLGISAAVYRTRDGREPWHPEQSLPVEVALASSARTTIAVGQPADLVLTDIDPLVASVDELRTMPVAATLLGGRFSYNAL